MWEGSGWEQLHRQTHSMATMCQGPIPYHMAAVWQIARWQFITTSLGTQEQIAYD